MCRQNYPMCKANAAFPSDLVQTPCKSSCNAFSKRCPGANMQCDEFATQGCIKYKYMTPAAYQTAHAFGELQLVGWPSVAIAIGLLLLILGIAFLAAKLDKSRVDAEAKRKREAEKLKREEADKEALRAMEEANKVPGADRKRL
jgi:hypothetical protein